MKNSEKLVAMLTNKERAEMIGEYFEYEVNNLNKTTGDNYISVDRKVIENWLDRDVELDKYWRSEKCSQ